MVQPLSRSQKTQSPLPFSRSDRRGEVLDGRGLGQVYGHEACLRARFRQLACNQFTRLREHVAEHEARSVPGAGTGDGPPDAPRGPGHDDGTAGEHCSKPVGCHDGAATVLPGAAMR